jgi:hypothetical protein
VLAFASACSEQGVGLLQFAEDPEQRLAGVAQAVVDPLAAAVGLDEACGPGLKPREVGRDGGGAQAVLPGQLCSGARRYHTK